MAAAHADPNFDPAFWISQWEAVGGAFLVSATCVSFVGNLAGPRIDQQSLLGKLDSKAGRRERVRSEAITRWRRDRG